MIFGDEQYVRELLNECSKYGTEPVLIGAEALLFYFPDLEDFTRDADFVLSLDMDGYEELGQSLSQPGWKQELDREHRWYTPANTIIDLLPAGPSLRKQNQIIWPRSGHKMNLTGFDLVFTHAKLERLPQGLEIRITPISIIALLKMTAYLDDPIRRKKDLEHIDIILNRYEENGGRHFSDEVYSLNLVDYTYVAAALLGLDLGKLSCKQSDKIVFQFTDPFIKQLEESGEEDEDIVHAKQERLRRINACKIGYVAGHKLRRS